MLIIIFIPVTISPLSTAQQRGLQCAQKEFFNIQAPAVNLKSGQSIPPVTSQGIYPLPFLVLPLLGNKMFNYPMAWKLFGCYSLFGQKWKSLEYVQMLNSLSWPELAVNQCRTEHLLHGSDHISWAIWHLTSNRDWGFRPLYTQS